MHDDHKTKITDSWDDTIQVKRFRDDTSLYVVIKENRSGTQRRAEVELTPALARKLRKQLKRHLDAVDGE